MKKELNFHCKKCNDLTAHRFLVEGKVSEEWECKLCKTTRLFGK